MLNAAMQPVRVLSYNVRYFGHATRGLASTARAMRRIAEAIAALDPLPGLICLQEVETSSIRSTFAHRPVRDGETQLGRFVDMFDLARYEAGKRDRYEAYYFPAHVYGGARAPVYTTGLAILAHERFTIDHHNAEGPHDITHRHLHPIQRLKQTRICAHVRFRDKAGDAIDVFNTHLSLPSTMSRAFWTRGRRMGWGPNQLAEAKNLATFVARVKKSDRFFVVGDFNALPGSPVYRFLTEECGYADPFARLYQLTADELTHWPTAGFMHMRMHLDHVFTGHGLEWTDFDGSHPFGDRSAEFFGLSDHMPLIGRCRVTRAR